MLLLLWLRVAFLQKQDGHQPFTILYLHAKRLQKVKVVYSSSQKTISELRGVICHVGSHSVTCYPPDTSDTS